METGKNKKNEHPVNAPDARFHVYSDKYFFMSANSVFYHHQAM